MNEKDLINLVASVMPKSDAQENSLYECDCEIVNLGDRKLLVNIDEFSQEDYFREHDAYALGWNMALGSISDIYAAGGRPTFYLHSMVVCDCWDEKYIRGMSKGISDVLEKAGVAFLGGDMGKSKCWRYTGTVIGDHDGEPLKRSGAREGDAIYITGEVGAGNLEAFLNLYSDNPLLSKAAKGLKVLFNLRHKETNLINQYATACTDTSDGVFNGIKNLCNMSKTGFILRDLPYVKTGIILSKIASIPKALMLLGECGEYELLFTVKESDEKKFLDEAQNKGFKFYRIGTMCDPTNMVLVEGKREINLGGLNISARSFEDMREYIKSLIKYLKEN